MTLLQLATALAPLLSALLGSIIGVAKLSDRVNGIDKKLRDFIGMHGRRNTDQAAVVAILQVRVEALERKAS